jgi:hypothetical protein
MPKHLHNGKVLTNELRAVLKHKLSFSMLFFARFMFREVKGHEFFQYDYLKDIETALMDIYNYKTKHLTINIPPRFGKTMMIVIFIAWSLAKNPKANFLYITGGDALAAQTSKEIREIVDSEWFKLFFDVELRKDSKSVGLWNTGQGGGLKVATIKGVITGFGAGVLKDKIEFDEFGKTIFDGCVFIDDPNKILDTLSNNKNNSTVNDLYFNTLASRINSPWTNFVLVQQRAGDNDATEAIDEYYSDFGEVDSGCIKQKYVKLKMAAIKPDGTPLCSDKINLQKAEHLKTNYKTAYIWDTQYMQEPVNSDSYLFPEIELKRFSLSEFNEGYDAISLSCIDGADGGTDHFCAIHGKLIGKDIRRGTKIVRSYTFYVLDVNFVQGQRISQSIDETKAKILINKSSDCKAEINKEGSLLIDALRDDLQSCEIHPVYHSVNKLVRIRVQQKFVLDNFRFRNDYKVGSEYDLFMKKLVKYTKNTEHDDAPDNTASMANFIRNNFILQDSEENMANLMSI